MRKEKIYDVFWEGPYDWTERHEKMKDYHVLYQLYGLHHLYGYRVLLYIGMTSNIEQRLKWHEEWVEEEYDKVDIRFGSAGAFRNWQDWKEPGNYKKADDDLVKKIEALLIYANQPAYNTINKNGAPTSKGIRIFNSGKSGSLLPEVSYKYFSGD